MRRADRWESRCRARKRFYSGNLDHEGYWLVCNRPHGHRGDHASLITTIEKQWPNKAKERG